MKRIISVCILLGVILAAFSACGTNQVNKYAKIAVDEVNKIWGDAGYPMSITGVAVEINDPSKDFIPFPEDEDSEQNYKNVKSRALVHFTFGEQSLFCCVLINDKTNTHLYMSDEDYLESIADDIAASENPAFFKSFMLQREQKRRETYFPSADEVKMWTEVDISDLK